MAGQIMMTPEQMHQYAAQYHSGSENIDSTLRSLQSLQSQIEADWKGSGFQRFDEEFHQLVPQIQQFVRLLDEINQKLNQAADSMQSTDQQIASQFNM